MCAGDVGQIGVVTDHRANVDVQLARGDPAMGAGILATNASEVAARLADLRAVLARWSEDLERRDAAQLESRLADARVALVKDDA